MENEKLTKKQELEIKSFPKGYSKRYDKFTDSLNKKQFFEHMAIDEVRRNQIDFLVFDIKEKTIKEVLKLIKAWDGYGDDRFPEGKIKELVREIKKLKKVQ